MLTYICVFADQTAMEKMTELEPCNQIEYTQEMGEGKLKLLLVDFYNKKTHSTLLQTKVIFELKVVLQMGLSFGMP